MSVIRKLGVNETAPHPGGYGAANKAGQAVRVAAVWAGQSERCEARSGSKHRSIRPAWRRFRLNSLPPGAPFFPASGASAGMPAPFILLPAWRR